MQILDSFLNGLDIFLVWAANNLKQTTRSYCELETADSRHTLVMKDGSLISIIRLNGCGELMGPEEFKKIHSGVTRSLSSSLSRNGHALQVFFAYDRDLVKQEIKDIFAPSFDTADRLHLNLKDVFEERINHLANYCSTEACYLVLWTRLSAISDTQLKESNANTVARLKKQYVPPFQQAQNVIKLVPELREQHNSFVKNTLNDFGDVHLQVVLIDAHQAVAAIRKSVDPDVTSLEWKACLPGDTIPVREVKGVPALDISAVMWPPLWLQVIPRDGENLNLRHCRIGDRVYASFSIDLFPQEIQTFQELFRRTIPLNLPWRMSFFLESNGINTLGIKPLIASILVFASPVNGLIADSADVLRYLNDKTDTAIVKLRVSMATWAPVGEEALLRTRAAELMKALQGWGNCEVGEFSGDPFAGALSSALGITSNPIGCASVAPLNDVVTMLPLTRPASPWGQGALLFRSPDGKPWPYQPGSALQTTWIDLIYARPGSGKSVLSNAINLAICLQGGLKRLPRIGIIDIGPSSSGLISLLQEALPKDMRHLVAYHRLRMTPAYSINPFDLQLGCRAPTPQERSFLVNFVTLLATPIGETKPYDGIPDMAGLVVDELYKQLSDQGGNPHPYTKDMEPAIDKLLLEMKTPIDNRSSWWEVVEALFKGGYVHEAMIAQRYTAPLLADAVAICRTKVVEDLYGKIVAPTGEPLISAFGRMISSAVREYPLLSRITAFDLGDARVVSLDLDEVAKSGGESADRQTAIMYMLGRYVVAKNYYLNEDSLQDFPPLYRDYHHKRIIEIREDSKRLVFDEFHRTSKAKAVRDQIVVDMREGRKWKVQVALLSQSLEDFDSVMVEFATAVFIMDAGPKQAVDRAVETFGLNDSARIALSTRVHGPRAEGATFLVQFATKLGISTQLVSSTLGPIELWSFNTNADDARIRNSLYKEIGAKETRKLLSMLYPGGSAGKVIEQRVTQRKRQKADFTEEDEGSVIDELIAEILKIYQEHAISS